MTDDDAPPPTYRHNPRPVGYPLAFKLLRDRLVVDTTRKVEEIQLGAVSRIRLSYEPRSFAQRAFRTRLTLVTGRTVTFTSVSWNSLMDIRNQDAEYSEFVRTLIGAVTRANPDVELITGKHPVLWLGMVSAAALTLLAVALFAWRAFSLDAPGAALLGVLVAAVGIWQLEPIIRLNRPGRFTAGRLPEPLLPAGQAL